MSEKKNKLKIVGKLDGIDVKSGGEGEKKWTRAALKIIPTGEDKVSILSTFDETDRKLAIELMDKEIIAIYTLSDDEKYKNLVKGGLSKSSTDGNAKLDADVIEEEIVEDHPADKEAVPEGKPESTKTNKKVTYSKASDYVSKDDYWQKKFEFEKECYHDRQQKIIRQSSINQAIEYAKFVLQAVKEGVIDKNNLSDKWHQMNRVLDIAHVIESDVKRKE